MTLRYRQIDVFASAPFEGNGLAVFPDRGPLTAGQMQAIARELNQAESVFLASTERPGEASARIFTPAEELPFAGHPVLGAATVMHVEQRLGSDEAEWNLLLPGRRVVRVSTQDRGDSFFARMDQGAAVFSPPLKPEAAHPFLKALGLSGKDPHPELPLQVVSTGLPYLIVPLQHGLESARVSGPGLGAMLDAIGARFAYLLDTSTLEARTWDNDGGSEDPATGSAAGPAAAFLVRHGVRPAGEPVVVRQGLRIARPSTLRVTVSSLAGTLHVAVEGEVWLIGEGSLRLPPA